MKTKNIFSMLCAVAMTVVAFSSCNLIDDRSSNNLNSTCNDKYESSTISGQWTGNFGMYYTYRTYGYSKTYDASYTDIVFYQDYAGATKGWGRQVDWYNFGPYSKIQHKIYWHISNGYIYLEYAGESNLSCYIRNYSMSSSYFTGYFSNASSKFNLRKINSYYNWGIYNSDFNRVENANFSINVSLGKTRCATVKTDNVDESTENAQSEAEVIYGNHFCDDAK